VDKWISGEPLNKSVRPDIGIQKQFIDDIEEYWSILWGLMPHAWNLSTGGS